MRQIYHIDKDNKAKEQKINFSDEQLEIFAEKNPQFIYQKKANAIKLKVENGIVVADEEAIHAYHLDKTQTKLTELIDRKTYQAYRVIAGTDVTKAQEGRYNSKAEFAKTEKERLEVEADIRGITVDDLVALIGAKEAPFKYAKGRFDVLVEAFKTGVNIEREKPNPNWDKVYNYLLKGESIGKGLDVADDTTFDTLEASIRALFLGE